jgi:[ribosomal protein S5]-alanine N-acetyltransferase
MVRRGRRAVPFRAGSMTMGRIEIRQHRLSDAKRFVEILLHPDFVCFPVKPKSVEEEKAFLRLNAEKWREGVKFSFSVLLKGRLVGAVGIKVDQLRKHIGEIDYFIDRDYWGKGCASRAVRLAERFAFQELKLHRIEIITLRQNLASQRVAEKCGYRREGIQRGKIFHKGNYEDAYLYAKTK